MYASGKNGLGRDWHVQDFKTGKTLIRATSVYLMMDKKTRKVFKFIEEAREEIKPFIMLCDPIIHNNSRKLLKVDMDKADQVRTVVAYSCNSLLVYSVAENHELLALTLEYRKECNNGSLLQSFSRIISNNNDEIEFDHLLCLEGGQEIMRENHVVTNICRQIHKESSNSDGKCL
ncbi:hypothetical protein JRO89_XS09G0145900 [Xanthoceras sorbifolium]|uniref:Acyl-[acyl-carrier-protein] hydrolase n=1 Tax=Xanthoceras sorbifolium TaxID=99658 RepID=A0ABQ8HLL3_9ROSI|nr:hypothetical protein JRO89_XS09G0145900 [Xanthoceras sorbifolium]